MKWFLGRKKNNNPETLLDQFRLGLDTNLLEDVLYGKIGIVLEDMTVDEEKEKILLVDGKLYNASALVSLDKYDEVVVKEKRGSIGMLSQLR